MPLPKQEGLTAEQQVPFYTRQMARWEELTTKLNNGGRFTSTETEEYYTLDKQLESLRSDRPELYNQAVTALNAFDKARGSAPGTPGALTGGGGDASTAFSRTFSEQTQRDTRASQDIKQTSVQYVDLPTADEFLNDFENSYNMHITGLVQSGAINPAVAAFARENIGQVFGEYLREQTSRLLKGEPLWRVVGQNADNKLVGRRTGENTYTDSARAEESKSDFNRYEAERAVTTSGAGGTAGAAPGPSTTPLGQAVEQASSAGTTSGTSKEDSYQREQTKFAQDEALVSRNRLGYVANLAPLDFLKDKATSQRLNLLYGGYKGARTREQQTAAGQATVQARRI